jgi:hypothetical protein
MGKQSETNGAMQNITRKYGVSSVWQELLRRRIEWNDKNYKCEL